MSLPLSNLALWLEADYEVYHDTGVTLCTNSQTVAQWNDRSGNGLNATQSTSGIAPTFLTSQAGSLPGIKFNGSTNYLFNAYTSWPGTLLVVRSIAGNAQFQAYLGADDSTHSTNAGAYYYGLYEPTGSLPLLVTSILRTTTSGSGGQVFLSISETANNVIMLDTFQTNSSTTTLSVSCNASQGNQASSTTWTGTLEPIDGTTNLPIIGAAYDTRALTHFFNGTIFAIVAYSTVLNSAQLVQAQEYLWKKWVFQGSINFIASTWSGDYSWTGSHGDNNLYQYLEMLYSTDGINFTTGVLNYPMHVGTDSLGTVMSDTVRDPSIMYYNGIYYIAHTVQYPINCNYFDIATSSDLITWTYLTSVQSFVNTYSNTWAPEWFFDTSDNSWHIIFSYGVGTSGSEISSMAFYEVHPINLSMTTWSAPVAITGTSLPAGVWDAFIYFSGGKYWFFYHNHNNNYVEIMTSTSLTSGYILKYTGNWMGAGQNAFGTGVEGPIMRLIGSTWYFYADWNASGFYYTTQSQGSGDWLGTNTNAWSTLSPVTCNGNSSIYTRHGTVIASPISNSTITGKRLLENSSKRELESIANFLLLEGVQPTVSIASIFPDPFQATSTPKTQSFLGATAIFKTCNPFASTSTIKAIDPLLATTKLYGS